jgi:hypothetical protein
VPGYRSWDGYFIGKISVTGYWRYNQTPEGGGVMRTIEKTVQTGVASNGCTVQVQIESVGYQTSNPVLGDGVLADTTEQVV